MIYFCKMREITSMDKKDEWIFHRMRLLWIYLQKDCQKGWLLLMSKSMSFSQQSRYKRFSFIIWKGLRKREELLLRVANWSFSRSRHILILPPIKCYYRQPPPIFSPKGFLKALRTNSKVAMIQLILLGRRIVASQDSSKNASLLL